MVVPALKIKGFDISRNLHEISNPIFWVIGKYFKMSAEMFA